MDDKQAMHAMSIDDAYHVERTLARGPSGVTELVSIDGVRSRRKSLAAYDDAGGILYETQTASRMECRERRFQGRA